jgi:hypothetical protein
MVFIAVCVLDGWLSFLLLERDILEVGSGCSELRTARQALR